MSLVYRIMSTKKTMVVVRKAIETLINSIRLFFCSMFAGPCNEQTIFLVLWEFYTGKLNQYNQFYIHPLKNDSILFMFPDQLSFTILNKFNQLSFTSLNKFIQVATQSGFVVMADSPFFSFQVWYCQLASLFVIA